jgi:ABC-type branched-subunit amino acid transport system substrate-binding protein
MGMKITKNLTGFLLVLFLSTQPSFAQPTPTLPVDEKAEQLVLLGKKYLSTENYKEASQTFILASQRPDNQLTTAVIYYLGLSWYYLEELENARRRFDQLIKEYPESKYVDEAKYHLALVNLESPHVNDKERGLDLILRLSDGAKENKLRTDAFNAARHFLHDVYDLKFLELYYMFVEEKHRITVQEAICHQLDTKNNGSQILNNIKSLEEEGQKLSPYLEGLKKRYSSSGAGNGIGKIVSGGEIHIAIMLSFNLDYVDTASGVPMKSMRALDIYEGIRYALEEAQGQPGPHFVIKVWDTEGDSTVTKSKLEELEEFDPDFIVGDIGNGVNIVLGRWAESNKVVQIIPRSPLDDLIRGKKFVFLAHPSLRTQGEAMAVHVVTKLGLDRILVLNDYSYNTSEYVKAFVEKAKELGAHPEETRILPKFDATIKYIPNRIRTGGYEGIYVPIESEENMGLLLSQLMVNRVKVPVFTSNEIEKMAAVDADSKTEAQITYSTHYCECNDSAGLAVFRQEFVDAWNLSPQDYTVQGYDIMRYLLSLFETGSKTSFPDQLRNAEKLHRLHIDFQMDQKQTNQRVNIVRFIDGRLIKVN